MQLEDWSILSRCFIFYPDVQIRIFFGPYWTIFGLHARFYRVSLHFSVPIRQNTDKKKLRISIPFTQCYALLLTNKKKYLLFLVHILMCVFVCSFYALYYRISSNKRRDSNMRHTFSQSDQNKRRTLICGAYLKFDHSLCVTTLNAYGISIQTRKQRK